MIIFIIMDWAVYSVPSRNVSRLPKHDRYIVLVYIAGLLYFKVDRILLNYSIRK